MITKNPGPDTITIRLADWPVDAVAIRAVRRQVFVVEQNVPEELEWDQQDAQCVHAVAIALDGTIVATGRLLADGHIGRMAVLKAWRGQYIGSAVLKLLVVHSQQRGLSEVVLSSQVQAIPFYQHHGFVVEGSEYMEAGILHQDMRKKL